MEEAKEFLIRFQDTSLAEANIFAEDLRNAIMDSHPDVSVERQRDDTTTQDFGATLILLLGAPAVVAVVKAIGDWLKLHNSSTVSITSPNGTLIAENITSKQVLKLTEMFQKEYVPTTATKS